MQKKKSNHCSLTFHIISCHSLTFYIISSVPTVPYIELLLSSQLPLLSETTFGLCSKLTCTSPAISVEETDEVRKKHECLSKAVGQMLKWHKTNNFKL